MPGNTPKVLWYGGRLWSNKAATVSLFGRGRSWLGGSIRNAGRDLQKQADNRNGWSFQPINYSLGITTCRVHIIA